MIFSDHLDFGVCFWQPPPFCQLLLSGNVNISKGADQFVAFFGLSLHITLPLQVYYSRLFLFHIECLCSFTSSHHFLSMSLEFQLVSS